MGVVYVAMHHKKLGQDDAILDRGDVPSEFRCDCARNKVGSHPDAENGYAVEERAPRPKMSKSFWCEV
jgi:hypothetical protein